MEYKRAKFRELIKTVGLEEKDYPGGAFEFVEIVESEMVWNLYISFSAVIGIDALKRLEERLIARFKNDDIKTVSVYYRFRNKTVEPEVLQDYYNHILASCCLERPRFEALKSFNTVFENDNITIYAANESEAEMIKRFVPSISAGFARYNLDNVEIAVSVSKFEVPIAEIIENNINKSTEEILAEQRMYELASKDKEKDKEKVYRKRKINAEINAPVTRLKDVPASEVQIIEYTQKYGSPKFVVEGDIIKAEIKEVRGGYKIYEGILFDENDSIIIKTFLNVNSSLDENFYMNHAFKGNRVRVFGFLEYDKFADDVVLRIREMLGLGKSEEKRRADMMPRRRVELHAHTKMSVQDGVMDVADYVNCALEFRHRALAVTDHYNIQALPDLDALTRGADIKPIFGLEGVMVDENKFRIALTDADIDLDDAVYVVYDLETTGLSSNYNEIIEIAAVKIRGEEIVEEFSTYVKPKRPIPAEITEITSITEDDVRGAPPIGEVIGKFKDFIGEAILVAHNAIFDNSYLYKNLRDHKMFDGEYPSIDTLQLAKIRYASKLKTFNLKAVAKYFDVELVQHHRAIADARALAAVFLRMLKELRAAGIDNYGKINDLIVEEEAYANAFPTHITLLAKNREGIVNLNKIISASHTVYYYGEPRIPKKFLAEHRDGLLVGSACGNGEIFNLALRDDYEKLLRAVDFYDYLEIQPVDSYYHLFDTGDDAYDEACIKDAIKKIIKAGKARGKIIVATGDVHIINKEDTRLREIFINTPMVGGGLHPLYNARRLPSQHFRLTEEMLEEFAFLGKDQAEEIVIVNTNLIADMIERFPLFPDKLFAPSDDSLKNRGVPSMKQAVIDLTYERARNLYGKDLPPFIGDRVKKELDSIINNNFASIYYISHLLVKHSRDAGYIVGSRGSVGSSLVAFFMGITEVNALPPHYYCPKCNFLAIKLNNEEKKKYAPFVKAELFEETLQAAGTGYDLPAAECPLCGHDLGRDGVDIPFETFLGIKGDKVPDIDLNFSGEYQSRAHDFLRELFGEDHTFRAGTISTIADRMAWGFVKGFLERRGIQARRCEIVRLADKITGVKRSTGQHPGGIVVIPKEIDHNEIIPVQYPADDLSSPWRTTHYDYHKFEDNLLKMDILGHDDPTMIRHLMDYVEKEPEKFPFAAAEEIPLADEKVLALFSGLSSLGVDATDVREVVGTTGLPEFGTPLAKEMLREIRPKSVEELIKISGLSHGRDVWAGNARELMLGVDKEAGAVPFRDLIGCRDDIMVYLLAKGLPALDAFKIMEDVRRGKGVEPHYEREMLAYNIPPWYIDSCKKIKYMFPKAHAAAYVIMALRIGWFKVHRPIYYYAAYFSRRATAFDVEAMVGGSKTINLRLNELDEKIKSRKASVKEQELYNTLLLALEMTVRGYTFQQINIFKSSWRDFVIEGNSLIIPFRALDSLGEATAKSITDAREEAPFTSERDVVRRTKVNATLFERMRQLGVFQGLPEDDQIELF
ncbi:MAG: PolC-type DNA polymerase III [Bacilli bacterium]